MKTKNLSVIKILALLLVMIMLTPLGVIKMTVQAAVNDYTPPSNNEIITYRSERHKICWLQEALKAVGYDPGPIDGLLGVKTENATRNYQRANGLTVDGIAGPQTITSLKSKLSQMQTPLKIISFTCSTMKGTTRDRYDFKVVTNIPAKAVYSTFDGAGWYSFTPSQNNTNWVELNGPGGVKTGANRAVKVTVYGYNGEIVSQTIYITVTENPSPQQPSSSDQRSKILNYAKSQLGQGNIYSAKFGAPGVAWCAYFISYCAQQAGIPESNFIQTGWCPSMMQFFKNKGVFHYRGGSYTPRAGDIIFFDWNSAGGADHVGIITEVSGSKITFIDGNSGSKYYVSYQTWATTSDSRVTGYASPY